MKIVTKTKDYTKEVDLTVDEYLDILFGQSDFVKLKQELINEVIKN